MISGDLNILAKYLFDTFVQRTDLYAYQLENGGYVCVHTPISLKHVYLHLKGDLTLGTYVLDQASQARFIVFDADDDGQYERLDQASNSLLHHSIFSYLESSRRGGHLWLFFQEPLSGRDARLFSQGIAEAYSLADIELFPKQDCVGDGPGSLIRMPFGIHKKSGLRYGFIFPGSGNIDHSIEDQITLLGQPSTVSEAAFNEFWRIGVLGVEKPGEDKPKDNGNSHETYLSDKIKAAVSVYDFVSLYVNLTPAGRGLCPFHDDHNASFSVNIRDNYWKCFAGCGRGSVIDFWMLWKNCDFLEALYELRNFLL